MWLEPNVQPSTSPAHRPAFATFARTTQNGVHLLNGVPIHQTAFARDPRNPVMTSHLPTLLSSLGGVRVVTLKELHQQKAGMMLEAHDRLINWRTINHPRTRKRRQHEFYFHAHAARSNRQKALEVFATLADSKLEYVGFKDIGLPLSDPQELSRAIRASGKKVMLEVVSLEREAELQSANAAITLEVDYLLGGTHATDVLPLLEGTDIQYFPFPGRIEGHPSNLCGTPSELVNSAKDLTALEGVHGLDLLAYRWNGDGPALTKAVASSVNKPVIAAGSLDNWERIQALQRAGVWGFTIGSAMFANQYPGGSIRAQVDWVLQELAKLEH
jgi:Sugar-binding N-terminal domain